MTGARLLRLASGTAVALVLLAVAPAVPQVVLQSAPRLEPVAETKLLMEGLNLPNYQALQRNLKQQPADTETWVYVRGQALLIAECGNLLLVRPPRNAGQAVWLDRAADLRTAATRLARAAAGRDYDRSRSALLDVAAACNSCHQSFRVSARLSAFGVQPGPAAPAPPTGKTP